MINSLVDAVLRVAPSKKSSNFVKGVIPVNPEVGYSLVDTSSVLNVLINWKYVLNV